MHGLVVIHLFLTFRFHNQCKHDILIVDILDAHVVVVILCCVCYLLNYHKTMNKL